MAGHRTTITQPRCHIARFNCAAHSGRQPPSNMTFGQLGGSAILLLQKPPGRISADEKIMIDK